MKKIKIDMFTSSIHREIKDGSLVGASRRMKIPYKPTPQRPLILSASELGAFLRCRVQWNWKYRVGLNPKSFGPPRAIGILVSLAKEEWYRLPARKRTVNRMVKIATAVSKSKEVDADKKDRELARAMLIGFSEWTRNDDADNGDAFVGKRDAQVFTEDEFVLALTDDKTVYVRGKLDERFEPTTRKRTLAVDETKTKKTIAFDMLDLNNQLTTYLWAMSVKHPGYRRYLGYRTVLRRQMPGPRVKAALFGRSDPVERSEEDIALWVQDTRRIARDIMDAAIYPTPTEDCAWGCDFYNLCLVRSNKADVKSIIRSEFTTKQ
jgi:hypothetical protein